MKRNGFKPHKWFLINLLEIPIWSSFGFQNACSPLIEQLIFFHRYSLIFLVLIISIILYNLIIILINININKYILESQYIELFWTITPSFILILIGLPSIRLLYLIDEVYKPIITIKIIGHQWYWSYEYSDFLNIEFDSYITPNSKLLRLLDVDNHTIIPLNTQIRALISSTDVLHSWTIPSIGVKADAIPGRLNQINFLRRRPGIFLGQCSEICGANHSFIPILIEVINLNSFINWIKKINSSNGWK